MIKKLLHDGAESSSCLIKLKNLNFIEIAAQSIASRVNYGNLQSNFPP